MIFVWRLNHITYYRFCFEFPLIRDEPFFISIGYILLELVSTFITFDHPLYRELISVYSYKVYVVRSKQGMEYDTQ